MKKMSQILLSPNRVLGLCNINDQEFSIADVLNQKGHIRRNIASKTVSGFR